MSVSARAQQVESASILYVILCVPAEGSGGEGEGFVWAMNEWFDEYSSGMCYLRFKSVSAACATQGSRAFYWHVLDVLCAVI